MALGSRRDGQIQIGSQQRETLRAFVAEVERVRSALRLGLRLGEFGDGWFCSFGFVLWGRNWR